MDIEKLRKDFEEHESTRANFQAVQLGRYVQSDEYYWRELEERWQGFQAHAALQEAKPAIRHRDVLAICDAYESGIGHGLQNDGHSSGDIFGDPECGKAYEIGYAEGAKRTKKAKPEAAALRKLCNQLIGMKSRMRHTPGTGQNHSYLLCEDVFAYVDEALKTLPSEAAAVPMSDDEIVRRCVTAFRRDAIPIPEWVIPFARVLLAANGEVRDV